MSTEPTKSELQAFVEAYNDAGLPKRNIAPVTDALKRSDEISDEGSKLAAAARVSPQDIAASIAAGTLSVEDGVAKSRDAYAHVSPISAANPQSIAEALVKDAQRECHREARRFLRVNAYELAAAADAKGNDGVRAFMVLHGYLPAPDEERPQAQNMITTKTPQAAQMR